MKKVIIIGAGPAGLAAGYRLCGYRINPIILEKDSCVVGSLTGILGAAGSHYLGLWFILCAVLSSGCDLIRLQERVSKLTTKSIIVGFFFSLLISQNFIDARIHQKTYFSEDKQIISKLVEYCLGDTCLVLLPLHPIFNHNATRLYSEWQYYFTDKFLSVRDDAKSRDIAEAIIKLRPAVIAYKYDKRGIERGILLDLFLRGLISKDDCKKLRSLLDENYTVKSIGRTEYYIRNDKL